MNRRLFVVTLVVLLTVGCVVVGALAQETEVQDTDTVEVADQPGTAFTYQGYLTEGGVAPEDSDYDFTFTLYTAASGGSLIGGPVTRNNVRVMNGIFTVVLNFGANAFNGDPRYLQIAVRPTGSSDLPTSLSPRQELTPAPYALALPDVVPLNSAVRFGPPGDAVDLYREGTKFGFRNLEGEKLFTISREDGHLWVNGLKPVRIQRFENIGNDGDIDTGILASEYFCVAAGWSTHYNVQSGGDHNNMVWTYVQGSTWRVKVSFASQFNHENPDVDVVCFRREIAAWEASGALPTLNDPD